MPDFIGVYGEHALKLNLLKLRGISQYYPTPGFIAVLDIWRYLRE